MDSSEVGDKGGLVEGCASLVEDQEGSVFQGLLQSFIQIILCEEISARVGVEGEEYQFFRVHSSVIVNLKCFDKKFLASDSISLLAVWIEWLGLHLSAVLSRFWLSRCSIS